MSRASVQQHIADAETVLLIASPGAQRTLGALLSAEAYRVLICEAPEQAVALADEHELKAIVVFKADPAVAADHDIASLREHFPDTPLLLCAERIDRWEVRSSLLSGVSGIVLEQDLPAALGHSLRAAAAGQICVPRVHSEQLEPPALSRREKQILSLVVMGYMNSQIAEQLFLAESTVKSHLRSAFGKLGVRSRNEAVEAIVNPDRGLGMGILGLDSEPLEPLLSAHA